MRRFRLLRHGDSGLCPEVLHDDFLDVAIAPVQIADSQQSIDSIFHSFADADQQASGEWNFLLPSFCNRSKALAGSLVGSVVMRRARPH